MLTVTTVMHSLDSGTLNLQNCPLEHFIPIWMIVSGSIIAFTQLRFILKKVRAKCEGSESNEEESGSFMDRMFDLIGLFNIAWFFAGVWQLL